eukprot:3060657-Amphidinium_carterae.1
MHALPILHRGRSSSRRLNHIATKAFNVAAGEQDFHCPSICGWRVSTIRRTNPLVVRWSAVMKNPDFDKATKTVEDSYRKVYIDNELNCSQQERTDSEKEIFTYGRPSPGRYNKGKGKCRGKPEGSYDKNTLRLALRCFVER